MATPMFSVALSSTEEAQTLATFPVKMPSALPSQFQLGALKQWWPGGDVANRPTKPHADFVEARYADAGGHYLSIIQGFTGALFSLTKLGPPSGSSGSLNIGGKSAVWLTALPTPGVSIDRSSGTGVIKSWQQGAIAYVGWQDGFHPGSPGQYAGSTPPGQPAGSPRFYGLSSDVLTIAQLAAIAESVPSTPFVTTP